jgi:hypothetical protein
VAERLTASEKLLQQAGAGRWRPDAHLINTMLYHIIVCLLLLLQEIRLRLSLKVARIYTLKCSSFRDCATQHIGTYDLWTARVQLCAISSVITFHNIYAVSIECRIDIIQFNLIFH